MRSSILPVHAVVRPLKVAVATCASLAFDTTLLSIVQVVPVHDTVISPLSQSDTAPDIMISPLPSKEVEFIVFIFVPDTSVVCFQSI